MVHNKPIQINLSHILAERLGSKAKFVPRLLVHAAERLICQDRLNELLRLNFPLRGVAFAEGLLKHLNVQLRIRNGENMPANKRCIIVSNHPLGGLDGITMIAWLSRHYGSDVHFVVNDLLMAVEPLRECFVPINKHGAQSRKAASDLDSVLKGDGPVVIYPAGLVSRQQDDGSIADLKWQKMVINKAIEYQRDIVPVHFDGRNSSSFYSWARRRVRLGIKFNYEMLLLPREFVGAQNSTFTLTVGHTIPWQSFKGGAKAAGEAQELRSIVYSLANNNSNP